MLRRTCFKCFWASCGTPYLFESKSGTSGAVAEMGVRTAFIESLQVLRKIVKTVNYKSLPLKSKLFTSINSSAIQDIPSHIAFPVYAKTGLVPDPPRNVEIKNNMQVDAVRHACQVARQVVTFAGQLVNVGITTDEIDRAVHQSILDHGAYPSPLNYKGFPKSVCTSVNDVTVHGIPNSYSLKDGDIISIDVSVFIGGVHGDLCETFMVGNVDNAGSKLVDISRKCLDTAIGVCGPGVRFSTIGNTISSLAAQHGFSVCPYSHGHGIGSVFHALPDICHVANSRAGKMEPGMTFTIEPVILEGLPGIDVLDDGWTMVTQDGKRASQFEETVLITSDGVEVLTQDLLKH